jgi:hypothetical protein
MADILRFRPRTRTGTRHYPVRGETADIVFFPGVRYDNQKETENEDGPPAAPIKGARGNK